MCQTELKVAQREPSNGGVTILDCKVRKYHSQEVDNTKMSYYRCFGDCSMCYWNR